MMVFKLVMQAELYRRKLNGARRPAHGIRGVVFTNGAETQAAGPGANGIGS